MIQTRDILTYYVTEIFRDYLDILEFEYSGVPGINEVAGSINNLFKEARDRTFGNSHPCFYKYEGSSSLSAEGEFPEVGPEALKIAAKLQKSIPRDDYLFLMAVVSEDSSLEAKYLAEAIRISPGKIHFHIANALDDDDDNFPVVLKNLKAIPVKPVTVQEKNFFAIVRLIELIECRPEQCTPGALTRLLKKVTLNPIMMYSILYILLHTVGKETSFKIFCNLKLPGNDKYGFGKLLMGAAYYRLGKYREAADLLEPADIPSCRIMTEHQVEYQYYLAESYRKTGKEGSAFLLKKELYDDPHNEGIFCIFWYETMLDLAGYYLERGMTDNAGKMIRECESYGPLYLPFERLHSYYRMLGDMYSTTRPGHAHECYMRSELVKFYNN